MNELKIRCFTNLDDYKSQEWPESLPVAPLVGQRIKAKSGISLKVIETTWLFSGTLEVELYESY